MSSTPSHLKALEEVEREGIPGLVEVLREEGHDARDVLLAAPPPGDRMRFGHPPDSQMQA